jgi:hypothetical protein
MLEPELPSRRSPAAAAVDAELVATLRMMILENDDITARGALRRMRRANHPTDLTRDTWRKAALALWRDEQVRLRSLAGRLDGESRESLKVRAEEDRTKLHAMQRENDMLRAGLFALVRAVGEGGAIRRWRKFFEGYDEVFCLLQLEGVPSDPAVLDLAAARSARIAGGPK